MLQKILRPFAAEPKVTDYQSDMARINIPWRENAAVKLQCVQKTTRTIR